MGRGPEVRLGKIREWGKVRIVDHVAGGGEVFGEVVGFVPEKT